MATQVVNNGASITITTDGSARPVLKNQIRDINVVRDTIIKIDIGQGTLNNVFVDQADVTSPISKSPEDLRDQLIAMLQGNAAGLATESKQDAEIDLMKSLQNTLQSNQLFGEPAMVDENNPNYIYKGYATPGVKTSDAVWAIEKITSKKGVLSYQWAGGTKNFDKVWDNRATLVFS